jgi:ketosteroid isomerase-like protein
MQAGKWKQAVEAFLDDYVEAFTANDGARIARLYHAPCVTVRADGSIHSFQTESEAQAFFQRLADTYYRDGCRGWKYENLEVSPLGGRSAVATMDWQMQREDGSAIRRWRQSYNFVEIDGRLRILASTFHLA